MRLRPLIFTMLLFGICLPRPLPASGGRPPRDPEPARPGQAARIPVQTFARLFGFSRVQESAKELRLTGKLHTLVLEKGGRRAILNNVLIWLHEPVVVVDGHWSLTSVDVQTNFAPVLSPETGLRGKGHRIVVLDPGHGGLDSGAVSAAGLQEKAVALDISLRVRRYLTAAGYTVFMTRHQDTFLSLEERPRRAKAWNADAFVSIHANSSAGNTAAGVETFLLAVPGFDSTNHVGAPSQIVHEGNRHDAANMSLAYELQRHLLTATGATDRGVRRSRFAILKESPAPAALVEVGFLSNPAEAAKLATVEHREQIARAIAQGIASYLTEVRRASLANPPSP